MKQIKKQIIPILLKYKVKDVDILFQPPADMGLEVVSLKRELEKKLEKKVDLVSFNGISKYLKKYILSNQVQLL